MNRTSDWSSDHCVAGSNPLRDMLKISSFDNFEMANMEHFPQSDTHGPTGYSAGTLPAKTCQASHTCTMYM